MFGCEAWGTEDIPLHASESMIGVVQSSPPLAPLFDNNHLIPTPFYSGKKVELTADLSVTPVKVPHRVEHTDTHAFLIE